MQKLICNQKNQKLILHSLEEHAYFLNFIFDMEWVFRAECVSSWMKKCTDLTKLSLRLFCATKNYRTFKNTVGWRQHTNCGRDKEADHQKLYSFPPTSAPAPPTCLQLCSHADGLSLHLGIESALWAQLLLSYTFGLCPPRIWNSNWSIRHQISSLSRQDMACICQRSQDTFEGLSWDKIWGFEFFTGF